MDKVYVITTGCYSDYHIESVYSSKEKAEEAIDILGSNYGIEEYVLNPELPEKKDGVWEVILKVDDKQVVTACGTVKTLWNNNTIQYCKFGPMNDEFYGIIIHVESNSQQRAIKIASERFGAIMANEKTMYPLLRAKLAYDNYPIYEFNTGRILISKEEDKKLYPPFVNFSIIYQTDIC